MVAGLAVTSATVVIFGSAVRDPVQLLSQLKQPAAVCLSLFGKQHNTSKCVLPHGKHAVQQDTHFRLSWLA
jgi:cytosine/uracil/thiamine/allantoin permease